MFVNFRTPHPFTRDELDNAELFADQAAVAIHNARLYEDLTQTVEDLSTALKRVRAATALATFGIVDREWRHNVSGFAPTIEGWVQIWRDALLRGEKEERIDAPLAAWLRDSADDFIARTRREIGQRPVMVQPDENLEPVAVNGLVREAVGTWKKREGLIDLNLGMRLEAADDDVVYANRRWLLAAIGTLIDNAARAVSDTSRRGVIVGTRRVGGTIELDFTDTGCGMTPDLRDGVFVRPQSTRQDGQGMGVGLIIAQSLAFTYDGEVKLVDHPAGEPGITVRITLPAHDPGDDESREAVEIS
jgi:signal transduction histidine kinase